MASDVSGPDPFEQWDAAYVFGALDPAERAVFDQHLNECADCRARVASAASTVALLGAPRELLTDTPPMPETLLPGLLGRARKERRTRRAGIGALAAVAAACLIALVVAVWPSSNHSASPVPRPQAMAAVQQSNVTATAALRPKAWGTEIDVHCRYAHADEPGPWSYALRVIDRSGQTHPAGTWQINNGQTIDFVGGTEVPRGRIARVQVTLPDGTPILQLAL